MERYFTFKLQRKRVYINIVTIRLIVRRPDICFFLYYKHAYKQKPSYRPIQNG